MRARHYKLIGLVFCFQALLILALVEWGNTDDNWLSRIAYISIYLVPFVAYIAILYGAPAFESLGSIPKMACLTFLSITGTVGGSFVIAIGGMLLSPLLGVPIRR